MFLVPLRLPLFIIDMSRERGTKLLDNKKLFIVDESYTNYGVINDTKGIETLKCNLVTFQSIKYLNVNNVFNKYISSTCYISIN
jgi:hypothetical protein